MVNLYYLDILKKINKMKQSAVEWLSNEFYEKLEVKGDGALFNDLVNQAKEIEKQQQYELAIGFVKWTISEETDSLIHDLKIVGEIDDNVTLEQLLEIYKKEKGL